MYFKLASHITNRLIRLYNSCTGSLCTVHRWTAAECDNTLAAVLDIHILTFLNVRNCRIRLNAVVNNIFNANLIELCEQRVKNMKSHKTLIGYNKNLIYTLAFNELRQFEHWAGTLKQGRLRPIHQAHSNLKYILVNSVPNFLQSPEHSITSLYYFNYILHNFTVFCNRKTKFILFTFVDTNIPLDYTVDRW